MALSASVLAGLLAASTASAQIMLGPTDDVESALNALDPGDEVILADGMYSLSGRFSFTAIGTAAQPIVIRAADGATPHFHRPDASQNIWDIDDAAYVTIRGLRFTGGSAGLRVSGADHLTIEDCEIAETEDVALRMNDGGVTYMAVQILRNHIHDTGGTGEGMYLGCNDDGCRLADSLIANNYVHHTNAGDVSQGDGIELKDGSYNVTIRDNVIHDTNYPCILGYSTSGNGGPNLVEGNVMWHCGDNGIQWEANATIRNNIVLGAGGSAMASQMHQENGPNELTIVHNTFINMGGDAIAIRNASGPVTVANNAAYSMGGRAIFVNGNAATITCEGNAGAGSVQGITTTLIAGDIGVDFVAASFSGDLPQDVFPTMTGALGGAGVAAHVVMFDFNGTDRMGVADIGAYALGDGTNPGGPIMEGFKPGPTGPGPGSDAGVPSGTDAGVAPGTDAGPRRDGGGVSPGTDAGPGGMDDGGCGCRAARPAGARWPSLALVALIALAWRRRR
ncbi:MAG: right-handed parallel beta-helix repeat-containing protein [Sandaracinaceae bacterium]